MGVNEIKQNLGTERRNEANISAERKELPKLYDKRENCCGCSACYSICQIHAISMEPDEEGFLYPVIDTERCVKCYKCLSVCAFKADQEEKGYLARGVYSVTLRKKVYGGRIKDMYDAPITYAAKHKNYDIRMLSRSGGIFTALSDCILADGGVVYGCALNEDFTAIHLRAVTENERNRMRGSKYIQSEMQDMFKKVKTDLEDGKKVLFSGTSCQVAGLISFLGEKYENLFTVDIVCHGVPSPLVWKDYLSWQEQKNDSKVRTVDFRNKIDFGWEAHVETLLMENGKRIDSTIFATLFYGHSIIRPCCFKCPYKDVLHPGDITIADYWGIKRAVSDFDDNKGVSLVLINNDKGNLIFKCASKDVEYCNTKLSESMQEPLLAPFDAPVRREKFWNDYNRKDFGYIARKYGEKISEAVP